MRHAYAGACCNHAIRAYEKTATASHHNQADGAASTNVYAKRVMGTEDPSPLILNAIKETSAGTLTTTLSRSRFYYDGSTNLNSIPVDGNLTREEHDRDGVWIHSDHLYDLRGNRTSTTDPRGNTTTFVYGDSTLAQPTSITVDPNNQVTGDEQTTQIVYDYYTGLVKSQTDPNNQATTISYNNQLLGTIDPFGRPGIVTGPFVTVNVEGQSSSQRRRVVTRYFDSANEVEVWSDLNAENDARLRSRLSVDHLGRTVLTESSEDGLTYSLSAETVYEQMGRIVYASNPHRTGANSTDGWTRATKDDLGRTVEVATFTGATKPSATATNWNGKVSTSYLANETTVTDQAGKVRRSITDGLGRLSRVDEPDANGNLGSSSSPAQPTSYVYDALGNLLQVNQGGQQRIFTYDTLSRLKTAKNPEQVNSSSVMVATSYTYDDASNLLTRSNPNGTSVSFTYDGLNRVMTKALSTGTWTYNYDTGTNGKGRMVSVTKGGDGYFYDGYDAMGRLTAGHQVTDSVSYTLTYGYDLAGNLTQQQYPSGRVITTVFDAAARLSTVSGQKAGESNKTYASQFQYTPHGGISQMTLGNSTRETMAYNSRLQPLMIESRKTTDNSLLLGLDYTYNTVGQANNNGNVHTQTIRFGATTFSQTYTYDSLNRLETAIETGSWSQSYGYDRWGNRRVLVPQSTGYPIDADLTPTQPTHISTATNRITMPGFNYDTSGNQTAQIRSSQSETLAYDSENRMTSFVSGGSTTSYVYDGDGRRVKKVVGSETTVFVYNAGGQLIAEYSTVQPQGSGTSYLTSDTLGSTRLVTDASGSVKARHDYLPYGEETGAGIGSRTVQMGYGAADSTRQRFTSKERDTESGLDYFLARYYSGAQGRFASIDPIIFQKEMMFDPQRFNLYAYTRNTPLSLIDPTGEAIELLGDEKQRKIALDALRSAVGEEAGAYLYENVEETVDSNGNVSRRYFVGIIDAEHMGKEKSFGEVNDVAEEVQSIIRDTEIVRIEIVPRNLGLPGSGNGKIGPVQELKTPGATFYRNEGFFGGGELVIQLMHPANPYGYIPGSAMSDGQSGSLDIGLTLAHELGHARVLMRGGGGRASSEAAVNLENKARRLRDPNAGTRLREDVYNDVLKQVGPSPGRYEETRKRP